MEALHEFLLKKYIDSRNKLDKLDNNKILWYFIDKSIGVTSLKMLEGYYCEIHVE